MPLDNRRDDRDRSSGRDRSPINYDRKENGKSSRKDCRIFISNYPYEHTWQDLKDLLRKEVGSVEFVELFVRENGKSKGTGVAEFETAELARKAVDKLHRYEINGRKIIVKEDDGEERDKFGHMLKNRSEDRDRDEGRRSSRGGNDRDSRGRGGGGGGGGGGGSGSIGGSGGGDMSWGETYGLSPAFLEGLGITPPLISRVFVANLNWSITEKKLRQVFKLAGKVRDVELSLDSEGKSRGMAVVEFDHPVEAVQAISMFHNQQLYDRGMTVRMDAKEMQEIDRLPEGLRGIGMGLGANGAPLKDVARNLSTINTSSNSSSAQPLQSNPFANLTAAAALSANPLSAITASFPALHAAALAAPGGAGLLGAGSNLLSASSLLAGRADPLPLSGLSGLGGGLGHSSSILPSPSRGNMDSGRNSYSDRERSSVASQPTIKSSDTIIVDNLPSNFSWQELKDKFRDVGDIKFAEMRGNIGLVRFTSDWEALRAVSLMDRSRVDGEIINVNLF